MRRPSCPGNNYFKRGPRRPGKLLHTVRVRMGHNSYHKQRQTPPDSSTHHDRQRIIAIIINVYFLFTPEMRIYVIYDKPNFKDSMLYTALQQSATFPSVINCNSFVEQTYKRLL